MVTSSVAVVITESRILDCRHTTKDVTAVSRDNQVQGVTMDMSSSFHVLR